MIDRQPTAPADAEYARLLADLRAIIAAGRGRAAAAVNQELVATYWAVGERIVREEQGGKVRAAYGARTLAQLGRALEREFGRGFGLRSLQLMRQFYLAYPIANALRSQLGWTHYRLLMRLPDPEQRDFYGRLAATGRWSSRELEREIGSRLFERVGLSRRAGDLAATLPAPVADDRALAPSDVFKDPYILDFLGLEDTYSERDLEAAILRNIERFLLELGTDFCFVARQRRLTIDVGRPGTSEGGSRSARITRSRKSRREARIAYPLPCAARHRRSLPATSAKDNLFAR